MSNIVQISLYHRQVKVKELSQPRSSDDHFNRNILIFVLSENTLIVVLSENGSVCTETRGENKKTSARLLDNKYIYCLGIKDIYEK